MPTKSGKGPFLFFDGATMMSYQLPHKTVESVFCRRQPTPKECLETNKLDVSNSDSTAFSPVIDRHLRNEPDRNLLEIVADNKEVRDKYLTGE